MSLLAARLPMLSIVASICVTPVSVTAQPSSLQVSLASAVLEDPVNGTVNPKTIPGSILQFTLEVVNGFPQPIADSTLTLDNPVPTGMALFVGAGEVASAFGADGGGLSCVYADPSSATDCLEFSADGGASFTYRPNPSADGFDRAITHFRAKPSGVLAPAGGRFTLTYRTQLQ